MCYILCTTSPLHGSYKLGAVGEPQGGGALIFLSDVFLSVFWQFSVHCFCFWGFVVHGGLAHGFLIPVKELRL